MLKKLKKQTKHYTIIVPWNLKFSGVTFVNFNFPIVVVDTYGKETLIDIGCWWLKSH